MSERPRNRQPARQKRPPTAIGWREWLALPGLGIERIKAKVDTGARSSALHAVDVERFDRDGAAWVRFSVHPVQRQARHTVTAEARLVDERWVRPSTGRSTLRPVIRSRAVVGRLSWPIEITLVNRDVMGFRMLLGRRAVRHRFLVDPGRSFLAGEPSARLVARATTKENQR